MNDIFKHIFDKAVMGFLLIDPITQMCVQINNSGKEMLSLQENSENSESSFAIQSIFPTKVRSNVAGLTMDLIQTEGFYSEVAVKKMDGQIFYAEVGVRKIAPAPNQFYLLMFTDITHQLKMRREISQKNEALAQAHDEILQQNLELRALDRAKDSFIALTSHELRTPLSAIISTAEVLELGAYDSDDEARRFIHTIYDQGRYLLAIVNDILDFSKIQAGRLEMYIRQGDVTDLVQGTLSLFEHFAKEKNVTLAFENTLSAPGQAQCFFDPIRFKQVLGNVLNNSIKFTHPQTEVKLTLEEDPEYVSLTISDQGPGIDKADHEKIFNEFETLQKIDTHHKGTGLGLPICRRLMQLQGGKIEVISEPGKGASFTLRLPKTKILPDENYKDFEEAA